MRILLVAHNVIYGDGQGRINLEIVRHALACGHTVAIAGDCVEREVVEAGAAVLPIRPSIRKPNLAKVISFVRRADAIVRESRSEHDVVVANGYVLTEPHDVNLCQFVHGAWAKSAAHRMGSRSWAGQIYQNLYTRYNSAGERVSYARAKRIVAPSARTAAELVEIGTPPAAIRVIPNGVDVNEYQPRKVERTEWGLPSDRPVACFAGDVRTNRKGLKSVLEAMVEVPELQLAVIGRSDGSPFPAYAQSLGIADRVWFLGFRKDVNRVMCACDFFVFPSHYEPFGIVVLEAMACGLPVITSRNTGAAEVLPEGTGTVLDDPEDVAALAAAMRRLVSDPVMRQRQGQAVTSIAAQYTWTHMARRYLEVFEECVFEGTDSQSQLRHSDQSAAVR